MAVLKSTARLSTGSHSSITEVHGCSTTHYSPRSRAQLTKTLASRFPCGQHLRRRRSPHIIYHRLAGSLDYPGVYRRQTAADSGLRGRNDDEASGWFQIARRCYKGQAPIPSCSIYPDPHIRDMHGGAESFDEQGDTASSRSDAEATRGFRWLNLGQLPFSVARMLNPSRKVNSIYVGDRTSFG